LLFDVTNIKTITNEMDERVEEKLQRMQRRKDESSNEQMENMKDLVA
jgi:hypothetical protein